MDLLRYVLSSAVIIAHINGLADYNLFSPISSFDAVGAFFVISGFLMYPNYTKHNNCITYARLRARKLLPPYFFIVLLCALGLVAVSSLSPKEYFTSPDWWKYLLANLSFLNWLHPSLPGVFTEPQYLRATVNGSLWTMKVEWCLYFSVPIFVLFLSKVRLDKKKLAFAIIVASIIYRIAFSYLFDKYHSPIYQIIGRQIFGQLSYFYCGMLVYFYKDTLKRHYLTLLIVGGILYYISSYGVILQCIFNPFAMSALVFAICFYPRNINILAHVPNVSYEMYLFHCPIIQLTLYDKIPRMNACSEVLIVFSLTIVLSYIAHYVIKFMRNHCLS